MPENTGVVEVRKLIVKIDELERIITVLNGDPGKPVGIGDMETAITLSAEIKEILTVLLGARRGLLTERLESLIKEGE